MDARGGSCGGKPHTSLTSLHHKDFIAGMSTQSEAPTGPVQSEGSNAGEAAGRTAERRSVKR